MSKTAILSLFHMPKKKIMLANDGQTVKETEETKSVMDMVVDSAIVGAIVFFSTWSGTADLNECLSALKGFGIAFFTQLAYYRGLKKGA